MIRGVGNGAGRARLKSDTTTRAPRPPRCLPLATAEDAPPGAQSIAARTLGVPFGPGDVDVAKLTVAQEPEEAHKRAFAGRMYVQFLIRKKYWNDAHAQMFADERRAFAAANGHARQPDALAFLMIGYRRFIEAAIHYGAVAPSEEQKMIDDARKALLALGEEQKTDLVENSPAERFLDIVRTLVAQNAVHLLKRNPSAPGVHGPAGAPMIGYYDDDGTSYLMPDAVYREVQKSCTQSGTAWATSPAATWKALADANHVEVGGDGRPTQKLRGMPRVLKCVADLGLRRGLS